MPNFLLNPYSVLIAFLHRKKHQTFRMWPNFITAGRGWVTQIRIKAQTGLARNQRKDG
jgi:hypothetical protein